MFATFAGLQFESDTGLRFSVAGHLPILCYRLATATISELSIPQLPLAMFDDRDVHVGDRRLGARRSVRHSHRRIERRVRQTVTPMRVQRITIFPRASPASISDRVSAQRLDQIAESVSEARHLARSRPLHVIRRGHALARRPSADGASGAGIESGRDGVRSFQISSSRRSARSTDRRIHRDDSRAGTARPLAGRNGFPDLVYIVVTLWLHWHDASAIR